MPRKVDHGARRAELLERCFQLFARRGLSAVQMREVARQGGVSIGTLYHYFPDKEGLVRQVITQVSEADVASGVAAAGGTWSGLVSWLSQKESRMRDALLLALDHRRLHPEDHALTREAIRRYRRGLEAATGLKGEAADQAFVYLLGTVVWRALDDEAPHLGARGA